MIFQRKIQFFAERCLCLCTFSQDLSRSFLWTSEAHSDMERCREQRSDRNAFEMFVYLLVLTKQWWAMAIVLRSSSLSLEYFLFMSLHRLQLMHRVVYTLRIPLILCVWRQRTLDRHTRRECKIFFAKLHFSFWRNCISSRTWALKSSQNGNFSPLILLRGWTPPWTQMLLSFFFIVSAWKSIE